MKGKMETGDVRIWQNRALKITLRYQISSELRFTICPNLLKNATIFPNSTGTSPQKVKKKKNTGSKDWTLRDVRQNWDWTWG